MVDPLAPLLSDPTPQLTQLRKALLRLSGSPLPAPARLALAEAQLAYAALEDVLIGSRAPVDRSVFDALLAMAGPEIAPELIIQMAADLRAVLMALAQGLAASDHDRIRAQTHVLVALAGAAGARGLAQGAQALNMAAQVREDGQIGDAKQIGNSRQIAELGPVVLAGLGALIVFVEGKRTAKGGRG